MSNDALKSFTTNSVKNSHEKEYRKMYIVETTRFDKKKFIPHYSSCFSENFVFVAEAVDKKLNLIIFSTKQKQKPDVKKFSFENSIVSISICCKSDNINSDEYSMLIVTQGDSFVISYVNQTETVTYVEVTQLTTAIIFWHDEKLSIICGCENNLIIKDTLDKSSKQISCDTNDSKVTHLCVSPSKIYVLVGCLDGSVSVLKTDTLEYVWSKQFSIGSIRSLSWNCTNSLFAFSGQDDNLYLIDLSNDYSVSCFEGHKSYINSVSFDLSSNNKNQQIFTSAEDAMIGIWLTKAKNNSIQIINQKFIGAFERPIRYIRAMKYFLITIDNEGAIICWRKIKKR